MGEAKPLLAKLAWPPGCGFELQGSVLTLVKSGCVTDHSDQGLVTDTSVRGPCSGWRGSGQGEINSRHREKLEESCPRLLFGSCVLRVLGGSL